MNEVDVHIGSRLRGRRLLLRRSIGTVAFLAGIDNDTLQAFENGHRRVPAVDMIKLCEILDMRPLDIFRGYPDAAQPDSAEPSGRIRLLPDPTDSSPV